MHIIWDWNGTLLSDVELAVSVFNRVLPRFGLPPVTVEAYRERFTFPVREAYRHFGVTDRMFPEVAENWSVMYEQEVARCPLRADALAVVSAIDRSGHTQGILSAARTDHLHRQVAAHPALAPHFRHMTGTDTFLGEGKLHLGRQYLAEGGYDPAEVLLVGDTCHDAEVARGMGVRCALVAGGHQSRRVMAEAGVPVFDSLTMWLKEWL